MVHNSPEKAKTEENPNNRSRYRKPYNKTTMSTIIMLIIIIVVTIIIIIVITIITTVIVGYNRMVLISLWGNRVIHIRRVVLLGGKELQDHNRNVVGVE